MLMPDVLLNDLLLLGQIADGVDEAEFDLDVQLHH